MPARNSRSVPGLLYPTAVRDDRCEHKHCQGPVEIDPPLVRHSRSVGYRRSPGNLASPVTRSIGWSRMSLWSAIVVMLSRFSRVPAAVPTHRGCAQTGHCQDDPYGDHRRSHGLALITAVSDQGYEAGDPGTDPGTGPCRLNLARLRNPRWGPGNRRSSAQLGVYSLVDFRADPVNQAFCDRAVIVAAKFVMCCCCGSDVIPRRLVHGVTLHLKILAGPPSRAVSRRFAARQSGRAFGLARSPRC
jgi:hypothetical protein